jgi:hypothetical protein
MAHTELTQMEMPIAVQSDSSATGGPRRATRRDASLRARGDRTTPDCRTARLTLAAAYPLALLYRRTRLR